MSWPGPIRILVALLSVAFARSVRADTATCAVCNQPISDVIIFRTDKASGGNKKTLCLECSRLPRECYLCGMPVKKDFTELSDHRILCARDAKVVVLDEAEAVQIAKGAKDSLDRLLSRFITFTDMVTLRLADRVDILDLFHVPGNDFDCPNVFGYTQRQTNHATNITYTVSLLSGLPAAQLRATAAHEWSHTWIMDHVGVGRQSQLERDAKEGFCELVAYLLVESRNEKAELGVIRSNAYTCGQLLLFIEAERRFGFNEIVDWIKFGVDPKLNADALERVRVVELPGPTNAPGLTIGPPASVAPPVELTLQGITWSRTRPMVLINGRTFEVNEEAKVLVNSSNVLVRCESIREDAVVIRVGGTGEARTLKLKRN